jgi:xylulokinase
MLIGAAGACLKWFRDEFEEQERLKGRSLGIDSYDMMNRLVSQAAQNIQGPLFLPYMAGRRSPDWNHNARGVFFGLSLSTSKAQMIKAIMEGCAFELLHNLEALGQLGYETSEVRIVGGVTKSEIWNQIWADVLNKRMVIPDTLGAPFGAALLAGKGVGIYDDLENSTTKMVKIKHAFEPDSSNRHQYAHLYNIYLRLIKKIDDEFNDLMVGNGVNTL